MRRFTLIIAATTLLSLACAKGGNSGQVGAAAATSNSGGAATPALAATPVFTSAYTDLNKDCEAAMKEDQIGEGQDMPMRCKGYGGYYISIGYSAWGSHIGVEKGDDGSFSMGLVNAGLGYSDEPGRKVEWRMADGKPFAVIVRAANYDEKAWNTGENPYQDKYKISEWLIVKGLKGYEHIDSRVEAKDPKANEKVREIADSNYAKK